MRNLKKFLALVLALMMTFSLMVTANAAIDTNAAVTDKDSITEEFKEAVAVLNGLKIITGYEDSTFRPDKSISRQEATALVYRLHSGDADNVKKDLYSTADNIAKFKDVDPNGAQQWSAGYIGYCANQEIIKGVGADRFNPTGNVTGYQMLAMVLRAIGYGQNGEYEGSGWQTRVATTATKLGMLKNIDDTNYAGTLSAPATRELVAEIVFQAALQGTVTYTPAFGYQEYGDASLGVQKFQLNCGNYTVIDKWGRPGYQWFKGSSPIATIKAQPVETYDTTKRECDVAHDLGITEDAAYSLYVNSNEAITDNYLIVATDTVTKVGGQGRITEFYGKLYHPHKNNTWPASVVMTDTFLAKVTKVETEVKDAAGHQMIPAKLTLMVYDGYSDSEAGTNSKSLPAGHERVAVKSSGNWEFAKGDFVTLNAYTDNNNGIDVNDANSGHTGISESNLAAFEAERTAVKANTANQFAYVEKITKCEPVLGKQTTIYWNQGKHNVNNEDKLDQLNLHLDVAGTTTDTTFAWYYDAKGNLIGIGDAPANINYGIITSIYSAFKQGEGNTTGEAVAKAHVKYADGSEGDVIIDKFYVNSGAITALATAGHLTTVAAMTDAADGTSVTNTTGVAELLPIYDNGSQNAMTTSVRKAAGLTPPNTMAHGTQSGWLHVAPVSAVNADTEAAAAGAATPWGRDTTTGAYGIIKGNLFKFVTSSDDAVTAIEVAGTNANTGMYDNHYNEVVTTAEKELSKNYAYLTVTTSTIRMDNDTKIVVRGCTTTGATGAVTFATAKDTITMYSGIDELPASIIVPINAEVDWADTDDNGIADVVYVYGVKKGSTGYGLFYYNGGAGQWNGNAATGSGWLRGWLDGKETDLTFTNKDLFDRVQLSTVEYGGHLFAMKLLDGEVETLLGNGDITAGNMDYFLADTGSAVNGPFAPNSSGVALNATKVATLAEITVADGITAIAGSTPFTVGDLTVNDYTASTKAVWLHDDGLKQNQDGVTYTDVRYNANNNTIEAGTYTTNGGVPTAVTYSTVYRLTGSSLILGDALHFLNIEDRVNDVTIVFESNAADAIRQVYVTTRPDITGPDGTGTAPAEKPGKPGADVQRIDGLATAALNTYLSAGGPNRVVYSPGAKADAADRSDAKNLLYFPFNGKNAATSATLIILNSRGETVYLETDAVAIAAGSGRYFRVDMSGQYVSAAATIHECFTADTYSYTIVDNTGVTLSSGNFTMG